VIELGVPGDDNQSKVDIRLNGRFRHKIAVIRRGDEGRQVDGGPMVPGPWAFAFGLCTVLSDTPIDHDPILDVEDGDLLVIEGDTYKLTIIRREWAELELIEEREEPVTFLVQVNAYGDGEVNGEPVWTGNAIKHETFEAAEEAAKDLFGRWTAVKFWRVIDSNGVFRAGNQGDAS